MVRPDVDTLAEENNTKGSFLGLKKYLSIRISYSLKYETETSWFS